MMNYNCRKMRDGTEKERQKKKGKKEARIWCNTTFLKQTLRNREERKKEPKKQ